MGKGLGLLLPRLHSRHRIKIRHNTYHLWWGCARLVPVICIRVSYENMMVLVSCITGQTADTYHGLGAWQVYDYYGSRSKKKEHITHHIVLEKIVSNKNCIKTQRFL